MIRYLRELRLLSIAMVACTCLLALIIADMLLDEDWPASKSAVADTDLVVHAAPGDAPRSTSMLSWASQMFNFPDGSGATAAPEASSRPPDRMNPDITGSIATDGADKGEAQAKGEAKADPAKPGAAKPPDAKPPGTIIPLDNQPTGAERAILERLQERRQELDARARELDIRESLIKAAETRMDGKLVELKETEANIKVETQQKDDAQAARFKSLVTMYENMKPRDAAKIFDRLEIGVLIEVASKIDPRHMADILAQMSPDTAEKLTVELASQAQQVKASGAPADLPKIQGQPAR
jgi:flagellar motility protein MotE (MotC chaperone)